MNGRANNHLMSTSVIKLKKRTEIGEGKNVHFYLWKGNLQSEKTNDARTWMAGGESS